MTLSRQSERLALVAALPFLGYGVAAFAVSRMVGMPAPYGVAMLTLVGLLLALTTCLHAGLRRMAAEEVRERESGKREEGALFEDQEREGAWVRARNQRQFERYALPSVAGVAAIVEATLGLYLLQLIAAKGPAPMADKAVAAAAILGCGAVVLYLYGSYLAGLAYRGTQPVLRAVAAELVGAGAVGGALALGLLFLNSDFPRVPVVVGQVIAGLLLVRAAEKVLNILIDVYRPRSGGAVSLPYESRLFGLIAQPRSMLASFGESLSYQFGIEVTERRVRQLAWGALPFVLLQVVIMELFTCVVVVNPGQRVVVERFGRPRADGVLEAGLHAKLPWPVDCVYRHDIDRVEQLYLGSPLPVNELNTNLWVDDESKPGDLFITPNHNAGTAEGDQTSFNLLVATIALHYRVTDLEAFLYQSAEPDALVKQLAQREVARYFAAHDLFDLLQTDWRDINRGLFEAVAAAVKQQALGVEVVDVGLVKLQPPKDAVAAFQGVIAATEDRERQLLIAEGAAENTATEAVKEHAAIITAAKEYAIGRELDAAAEIQNLKLRQGYYRAYPEMFREWAYLDTIQKGLKDRRKLVIATDAGHSVINLDLKEKPSTELFNFGQ